MELNFLFLSALFILIAAAKSTAQAQASIQCPSLPPAGHASQSYCKMSDGSLIYVNGVGPFDCEIPDNTMRPQRNEDSTTLESEKLPSKESTYCEVRLIQFTNDGNVHRGCCVDGVAIFDSRTSSLHSSVPKDRNQKPLEKLQSDRQVVNRKLQTQDEKELENDSEGTRYNERELKDLDKEDDDYDYDTDEADNLDSGEENENDDYSDYGYDEDDEDVDEDDVEDDEDDEDDEDNEDDEDDEDDEDEDDGEVDGEFTPDIKAESPLEK
ncbi:hypothetical protein J7337_001894 [Fusarium musae]|uniref:Uncharacterized protein n=1 Tax=Fusarium musae TaxID=1042133 RepID=A0A9P8DU72_9HYPO|nr:hypothetical protein J7337_001894 [Fusarium musae]KAG9508330.1 hypothetical protein J7337_001894 [Fusarium musae]